MIFKLALRNIIGNGWRSLINMIIIAIVMIGMIWMQAMYYSWFNLAEKQMREWEIGAGQYHQVDYKRFDAFSWDTSFAAIPDDLQAAIERKKAVSILLSSAVIYPQGRMMTVLANGISVNQTLLKLPTSVLQKSDSPLIPAFIGKAMSRSSRLQKGDIVTMRLKDKQGAFTAVDLEIVDIMESPVASTDTNKIWLSLSHLQELKGTPDMASIIVIDETVSESVQAEEWRFVSDTTLLQDLEQIKETETGQQYIMFALLLFLGMIAIFDTQILALFKRRKEIGMLNALGMTRSQIILLFTTEGVLYMVFSIFFTAILGYPLFWYYAVYGYRMPAGFEEFGFTGFDDTIRFEYPLHIILGTVIFVFILTAIVSWLPASKIAKLKPTDALRGKFKRGK